MINFHLGKFLQGRQFLWQALIQARDEAQKDNLATVPPSIFPRIKAEIETAVRDCAVSLRLEETDATCRYLDDLFARNENRPVRWGELHRRLEQLWEQIDQGLREEYFFHYPRTAAREILTIDHSWMSVVSSFPSVRREIECGLDCYAQENFSGCVFHMMRVAETGLRALAKERGISSVAKGKPLEWGTWKDVFEAIDEKLKLIKTAKNGPKREAAIAFYSGALSDLRSMQNVYRDPTMHFRDDYDSGETYSAIFRTKSLMENLAKRLKESRVRQINWGL